MCEDRSHSEGPRVCRRAALARLAALPAAFAIHAEQAVEETQQSDRWVAL